VHCGKNDESEKFTKTIMQILENLQQSWRKSALPGFLSWWGAQLKEMLPRAWRDWLEQNADQLWVVENEGKVELYRVGSEGKEQLLSFSDADELMRNKIQIEQVFKDFGKDKPAVWLMLSNEQVLKKSIRLPAAVQDDLGQMLGYEMDKHTPFKADEVFYHHKVTGLHGAMVNVSLVLIPKNDISGLISQLQRAGLDLDGIDIVEKGLSGKYNLLPDASRTRNSSTESRNLIVLSLLTIVLMASAMLLHIDVLDKRIEALQDMQQDSTAAAKNVVALRHSLEAEIKASGYIVGEKENTPSLLHVISELTAATPDDSWVQRLEVKGTEVKIQGQSAAANVLLEKLGALDGYDDVQIQGAVTEDRKSGLERFTIKMVAINLPRKSMPQEQSLEELGPLEVVQNEDVSEGEESVPESDVSQSLENEATIVDDVQEEGHLSDEDVEGESVPQSNTEEKPQDVDQKETKEEGGVK